MNAGQKRVVALALQYIRETKPDAYGLGLADSWTEADWDLWHKANPLPAESQRMMKMLLPVRQGCLTAGTPPHAVGLCRAETAANGDFQLGQNGLSTAGEIGTEPSTSFR